jgi:hypothetical protein
MSLSLTAIPNLAIGVLLGGLKRKIRYAATLAATVHPALLRVRQLQAAQGYVARDITDGA